MKLFDNTIMLNRYGSLLGYKSFFPMYANSSVYSNGIIIEGRIWLRLI